MKWKKTIAIFAISALFGVGSFLAFQFLTRADEKHGHGEKKHDDHDEHREGGEKHGHGHGEHGEHGEEIVKITPAEMKEFGVKLATAGPDKLKLHLSVTGEVISNPDRHAHVVPRVSGIVRSVSVTLGSKVRKGQILAVIDSRELALLKAEFLAAREWYQLAKSNYQRYQALWRDKVVPELQYLKSKEMLARAKIRYRSAMQRLKVLGFSDKYLQKLSYNSPKMTHYYIRAPISGEIIQKHLSIGEKVNPDSRIFIIADLRTVWVNLKIYQRDILKVRKGLTVKIYTYDKKLSAIGKIFYVTPTLDEQTRTASAYVQLPNPDGRWRPGLFVNGEIYVKEVPIPLAVLQTAVQKIEGKTVVFVQTDEGFVPRPVRLGRSDDRIFEVLGGLKPGERYVSVGSFLMKNQLLKSSFGGGHSH